MRTLLISSLILLSGCTFFSKKEMLAPKSIDGYSIDFYATKVTVGDKENYHNTERYYFKNGGTYIAKFPDRIDAIGNFVYHRKSSKIGQVICSYSQSNLLFSYVILLEFDNPNSGQWQATYKNEKIGSDAGTFTIFNKPN